MFVQKLEKTGCQISRYMYEMESAHKGEKILVPSGSIMGGFHCIVNRKYCIILYYGTDCATVCHLSPAL
jgi:hypothetical protein